MNTEENETILWNSEDNELMITSHRIRKRTRNAMNAAVKGFLLTQLDSCAVSGLENIHI